MSANSGDINVAKCQNFENPKDFYDIFVPFSYNIQKRWDLTKFIC